MKRRLASYVVTVWVLLACSWAALTLPYVGSGTDPVVLGGVAFATVLFGFLGPVGSPDTWLMTALLVLVLRLAHRAREAA